MLVLPIEPYHPNNTVNDEKDETLKNIIEILELLKKEHDVRDELSRSFNLRQIAINSKLL